jgi:protein-S-isoprenylcysteine O-methyltransferase Ste14
MHATEFEFRNRFWSICLTYFVGFGCYWLDPQNMVVVLVRWIFCRRDPHLHSLAARHAIQALFAVSAGLVTAAAWIRTWAGAYLRSDVVHDPAVHTERLVADGPYRHLRNPLYLGNMLLAIGMAGMASRTGSVILILGNLLIVLRLMGREEVALAQVQGEAYRSYVAEVPRFWPSLKPRMCPRGLQPKWLQAFLGEAWMWTFGISGWIFVWKLDEHVYRMILCVSAVPYFLMRIMQRRRHQS